MKIAILILVGLFFTSTYAADCNAGDPCDLTGNYGAQYGYRCLQVGATALCLCPGNGYEYDTPCRPCNRTDPSKNACRPNAKLDMCLDNNDCGKSYVCLCKDSLSGSSILTTNPDCDTTTAEVCTGTTPTGPSPCLNGGVFISGICHCPSGYGGLFCEDKNDLLLCQRVKCRNNGKCAGQTPNGPYEAVCLCPYGFSGEYCELTGTLGFCSPSSCMNSGACQEKVIGSTRFAYCQCQPGFNGTKCDKRYFTCTGVGKFQDDDMYAEGKYFECRSVNGSLRAERRSCPKGLRFDKIQQLCMIKTT